MSTLLFYFEDQITLPESPQYIMQLQTSPNAYVSTTFGANGGSAMIAGDVDAHAQALVNDIANNVPVSLVLNGTLRPGVSGTSGMVVENFTLEAAIGPEHFGLVGANTNVEGHGHFAIPEPASLGLAIVLLAACLLRRWRRAG